MAAKISSPICHYLVAVILTSLVVVGICVSSSGGVEARPNKRAPIHLDEDSWTRLLEGEWMFDLYAPWCPACKKLEPEWQKFAEWSDDLNINVASADVTTSPALSGRFMVRGLPTIYHVKDGVFRIYNGPRELTAMINFIEEQGWKSVEPVSRWLAPNTLQMSFLAYSFRVSMILRDIHNHLVNNVGLPYYISYLIFALCTVTIGTLLGLLIVFIIDFFCPAYPTSLQQQEDRKRRGEGKKTDSKADEIDPDDQEPDDSAKSSSERVRRRHKT